MIKQTGHKIFVIFLIIVLILPLFARPEPVNAQARSIVNVTSCFVGGVLAGWLSEYADAGMEALAEAMPGAIAELLGLGAIFIPEIVVPTRDMRLREIQRNYFRAWTNKESRMDIITRCVAREILDQMIGNTINVVRNHGRDGGSTFIRNWRNFITGAQYRGENIFRAILSNAAYCPHFGEELKTIFRANTRTALPRQNTRIDNLDPYLLRARCTMPTGWTIENYEADFVAYGGWSAFAELLEPQNNALGSFNMAVQEADEQRSFEETVDLSEATGGGYMGRRGRGATDSCLVMGANAQCLVYKDILTPGSTLQGYVADTFKAELDWITNVDELSEIITSLIQNLLNRVLDLSDNDDSRPVSADDLPIYRPTEGNQPPLSPGRPIEPLPPLPIPEPPTVPPGGGGTTPSLNCAQQGVSDNYRIPIAEAINYVVSNTTLESGSKTPSELGRFLDAVVSRLRNMGYRAGRVNNGQLRTDTIIVGTQTDTDGTVYDLILDSSGPGTIIDSIQTLCAGRGPWSWSVDPTSQPGGGAIGSGKICTDGGDMTGVWPRGMVTCISADYFPTGIPDPWGLCPTGGCVVINNNIYNPTPNEPSRWPVILRRNGSEIGFIEISQPDGVKIDYNITPGSRYYELYDLTGALICGGVNCARANITIP